jgi:hypothetical protein
VVVQNPKFRNWVSGLLSLSGSDDVFCCAKDIFFFFFLVLFFSFDFFVVVSFVWASLSLSSLSESLGQLGCMCPTSPQWWQVAFFCQASSLELAFSS